MELSARLGSLMPHRKAADVRAKFLPVKSAESFVTVRHRTLNLGKRLDEKARDRLRDRGGSMWPRITRIVPRYYFVTANTSMSSELCLRLHLVKNVRLEETYAKSEAIGKSQVMPMKQERGKWEIAE